ncbi:DUF7536 family protein [Halomarina litorea]|uniref:DUF7536 family protein n=1 Tax=Halomarina litorea TaxID=2961595 RepID=UPI0020C57303|nr:hypothetical protein [Halomarina sp. BCD28]
MSQRDDDPAPGTSGESVPERPGGLGGLLVDLGVERNARRGVVVGVVLAAFVYAVRFLELLGPAPQDAAGPVLFLALAFVLAVGTALLTTVALTLVSAYRRAKEL